MSRDSYDTSPPPHVMSFTPADVNAQPAPWKLTTAWKERLRSHSGLLAALQEEMVSHGRIRRRFVHSYARSAPVELFLVTMVWGFGATNVRWPGQNTLLADPPRDKIQAVITAVQTGGALAGWKALFHPDTKIDGLGMAFGTKLLYFAGYESRLRPRPLILDHNVRVALLDAGTGLCVHPEVRSSDYLDYLELAEAWASTMTFDGVTPGPDVVELALFRRGSVLLEAENDRRRARG
jgi:hypothetical protein